MVRTNLIIERERNSLELTDDNNNIFLDKELTPGLVPIGDTGLYVTPDEPADPMDCDRYPSSPYCGGIPFTREPIGLNPEIIINQCDVGIRFNPVLGFIKLPQFNLVYRKPECRTPESKPIVITDDDISIPTDSGFYYAWYSGAGNSILRSTSYLVKRIISVRKIDIPDFILQFRDRLEIIGQTYRWIYYEDFNSQGEWFYQHWEVIYEDCYGNILNMYTNQFNLPDGTVQQSLRSPVAYQNIEKDGYIVRKRYPPIDKYYQFGAPCPLLIDPPPLPKDKECCMTCCDDSLLKILLKKVNKLSEVVGVEDYPVSYPTSLVDSGNDSQNANVELTSLTQMFDWYVKRFDEIVGQFEIPIEIKDADILKEGDQPTTIRLPNIAEAIAELFMLAFQAQINTEVLINMTTRGLIEGGQDKQQNFISYQLLLSLVDWAGFKTKDVRKDMNLLFTPGENGLSKFLTESKQSVVVQEFAEKYGLEIDLMRFRKAASVLDSVFFRKINPDGDIKGQIMKYLLNSLDTSKKLDNVKGDSDSDNSFEKFLEDAEVGFTQTPGISDSTKPYGRDFNSRPRIRDLSQNQSNNNSGDA